MRWRPRIRTVLLVANLILLALPLTGVWILRLYESALLRQTESELIAQAAVLAASYRAAWLGAGGEAALAAMPAAKPEAELATLTPGQRPFPPWSAVLDFADDPILPPLADAVAAAEPADPSARRAGELLEPVLHEAQRLTLAAIRVVDAKGTVVATTGGEHALSLAGQHEVDAALAGAAVSTLRQRLGKSGAPPIESLGRASELRVFVALPALAEGRVLGAVILSRTPRSLGQALWGKRWHLAGLALVLAAGGLALAWVTARLITRPIGDVVRQARRAAAGERSAVAGLAHAGTREIAELSHSLVTMAETLEARADYIRGFAAEVSHEFKTPLAAMRGTVELLQEHLATMTEAERRRFLANLAEDVTRLDRLVRRLLDLARADVMRRSGTDRIDLAPIVDDVAQRYRESGLDIRIAAPPERVTAAIDRDSLEAALSNLLDNIRQHAGAGATAEISWRRNGTAAVLRVADDGAGISPGNAARIFDRFFTTSRDAGGTGLGLPIVRSRLAALGGAIDLVPSARGAVFEITLPRALAPGLA